MLVHRLRRWPNNKTTLGQRPLFTAFFVLICEDSLVFMVFVVYEGVIAGSRSRCMSAQQFIVGLMLVHNLYDFV